jgi:hypothetical protein
MRHEEYEDTEPEQNSLWVLYAEEADHGDRDIFGIVQVLACPEEERLFRAKVCYTTENRMVPYITERFVPSDLYVPLPDHDEWTHKYRDLLDWHLDHLTYREVADLVNGEPSYNANGERGFEALRFSLLDGVSNSIEEFSVHQGHGPSRYGRAVQQRVSDLPDWLQESVLDSEQQRWEGGAFDAEAASHLVQILELRQEYLDEDHEDDLVELVNEYGLEYDEYVEGHFTAHDCPSCDAALIERPKRDQGYIVLDCSGCDKKYEGVECEGQLLVEREITDEGGDA